LEPRLRENEKIVETLEEGWHAVLHRDPISTRELFKTAYRRGLFRTPVLTNQRLLFLKGDVIDYELPLAEILESRSDRHLRIGTPYMTLRLRDGSDIRIVFECIQERVLIGAAVEAEIAWRFAKQWAKKISLQSGSAKTQQK